MRIRFSRAFALFMASSLATGAVGQSVTVNGDTTGLPVWNRTAGLSSLSGAGSAVAYQTVEVTITDPSAFIAETTAITGGYDTYLHLYSGGFDPADQFTNLVAADDDDGIGLNSRITNAFDGPFAEGQYVLVVSGFNNGDSGEYALFLDGVLLGFGPSSSEQLSALEATIAQAGSQSLRVRVANVQAAVRESLVSRDANPVLVSRGQAASFAGGVYTWLKASRAYTSEDGSTVAVPVLQFGADIAVSRTVVAGVALGYGDISATSPDLTIEGAEATIQPYVGWRTGDWHGYGSLTFGQIVYDSIVSGAGVAAADGDLLAVNANFARDFSLDGDRTLTPFAQISAGKVDITATAGTLAGVGLQDRVEFQELRLGSMLASPLAGGTLTVGLSADYYHSSAPAGITTTQFNLTGWSGTMEVGYGLVTGAGLNVDTNLSVAGIGDDAVTLTGSLEVGFRF